MKRSEGTGTSIQIVMGCGETGGPLAALLEKSGRAILKHDPAKGFILSGVTGSVEAMHVCIPWSEEFLETVIGRASAWKPAVVILHSTVPVGTTRRLRETLPAVHSPIRGMHGAMERDLQGYVKYIGYDDSEEAEKASRAMEGVCTLRLLWDSRTTELGKLLELARYGLNIAFAREQAQICRKMGLSYELVVGEFIRGHNLGMEDRGTPHLRQQEISTPAGPIGGHCVLPGMKLLVDQFHPAILSEAYLREQAPQDLIHPTAIVHPDAQVGTGTRIWHWTHVREGAKIGKDCVLGQGCYVAEQVVIGDRVHIQNGVSVYNGVVIEDDAFIGPHVVFTNDLYPPSQTITPTRIQRGAAVGAGVVILCGLTIGAGAKVGAGAVVTKDIPAGEIWIGNPARLLQKNPDGMVAVERESLI